MSLLPVYPRMDLDLVSARGSTLVTADGRELLDMYGGHAVTPLGHGSSELAEVLAAGYRAIDFYSNSLRMSEQAEAAESLLRGSAHLHYAHFVNSGAEANEAALHLARRLTGRNKVVSFDCAFHGRTMGVLAATGLPSYRKRSTLPDDPTRNAFIPFGDERSLGVIDDTTAAVICESIPSLCGVRMPPPGYYPALQARCREVGAMLIFDEVQGGMGRVGRWFAHELFGVTPDLVTLAKSLAAGYPAGAMLTTRAIGDRVEYGELGTTFGGGPQACRMITEVCRLIRERDLVARTEQIFSAIKDEIGHLPHVEVRGAGCLIGVETKRPARDVRSALLECGIVVGLSGDAQTFRLLPAYTLSDAEIERFCNACRKVLTA